MIYYFCDIQCGFESIMRKGLFSYINSHFIVNCHKQHRIAKGQNLAKMKSV